jgi:AraC-like DNA-binding protein
MWHRSPELQNGPPIRQVLTSSDVTTVVHTLSNAYNDVTVRLPRTDHKLSMRLESFNLPNIKLGNLELSSSVFQAPEYPWYTVCLPVHGRVRVSSHGSSSAVGESRGVVISPGRPVEVEYLTHECRIQTILFGRSDLEAELSAMLDRPVTTAPHFEFDLDLMRPDGSAFQRAVALLTGELVDPAGMATIPAMSARLGRLVMTGLLVSQPHNYSQLLNGGTVTPGPRAIRTALAVIEERPAAIETVADIARASALSVRALDEGFRRHVGLSPMAYLRQVRLARAHEELVSADPDRTTASAVAHNWGFWHYGRFAAEYRKRYGRTPADTLRKTRSGDD